jgi:hypothetical protein
MDEQLIDIDDIIGELEKIFGSDPCGIFLPCTRKRKRKREEKDEKDEKEPREAEKMLLKELLNYLKMKHEKLLEMQLHMINMFVTTHRSETPVGDQSELVSVNAENASSLKLRKTLVISEEDIEKRVHALEKIKITMDRVDSMNDEERKKEFDYAQKEVLLSIITALVKAKQQIGVNTDKLRHLKIQILLGGRSYDEMYKLMNEYILHMYHAAPTPITTSADLLQFIRDQLPVLSACMSSYYQDQDEKYIIDFRIFLPVIKNYIESVLRESGIILEGDSRQIAELIMRIIREHICTFVQIAGYPDICIRHTIVHDAEKLIIEGVRKFLSDYTPPNKRRRIANNGAGGSLNRNRNHSRIKKYKNRTKHRTMRRTKYRTKCKTKYRTSRRYKIKNKKTRKIYKY